MEDGKGQRQRWRSKAMDTEGYKTLEERIAVIKESWLCGYITDQEFAYGAAKAVQDWIAETTSPEGRGNE